MRRPTVPALALLIVTGVLRIEAQQPTAVADLGTVIAVLQDPGSTALQQQGLVGKAYSGEVTVEDVSVSAGDKAVAFIDVDLGRQVVGGRVVAFVKMRFMAKTTDEKVVQLRKGKARLRGTLKDFTTLQSRFLGVEPTKWANFTDATVEGDNR